MDPRVAALRKVARQAGWHVTAITPARRRVYRHAWTEGDWTGRDSWQSVEVQIDGFSNEPTARVVIGGTTIPTMSVRGVDAISTLLHTKIPAERNITNERQDS